MVHLHHVCISVTNIEEYVEFFKQLGMTEQKRRGSEEEGNLQVWLNEGIQLKEVSSMNEGTNVDHIALYTDNLEETLKVAKAFGCKQLPKGEKWISLPNGVIVELMSE